MSLYYKIITYHSINILKPFNITWNTIVNKAIDIIKENKKWNILNNEKISFIINKAVNLDKKSKRLNNKVNRVLKLDINKINGQTNFLSIC